MVSFRLASSLQESIPRTYQRISTSSALHRIYNTQVLLGTLNPLVRGGEFVHIFTFSYDISAIEFKSQIRDMDGVLIGEFEIIRNTTNLSIRLSKADLLEVQNGSYTYDIRANDIYKIKGDIDVITGDTQ